MTLILLFLPSPPNIMQSLTPVGFDSIEAQTPAMFGVEHTIPEMNKIETLTPEMNDSGKL